MIIPIEVDVIMSILNNYHPKIKLQAEIEVDNKIAYVDAKLHRKNDYIYYDWYANETASGKIMNLFSTQPKNQIINIAKNVNTRVLTISNEKYYNKNMITLNKILERTVFLKI